MNHDYLATRAEAIDVDTGDNIIMHGSGEAHRVEMTRANHTQLQREMAGMLDDPLAALMAQVAIELNEMAAAPKARDLQPA